MTDIKDTEIEQLLAAQASQTRIALAAAPFTDS